MANEAPAVIAVDPSGKITLWSPGAEAALGHAAADAMGRSLEFIIPEDYRAQHWMGFRRAMESGRSDLQGTRVQFPTITASGATVDLAGYLYLMSSEGTSSGVVLVVDQ